MYNREAELKELLQTIVKQKFSGSFEVIVVDDGSDIKCQELIDQFGSVIPVTYYYKQNTGPGDSRNYGMDRATGDFFIILDSDVLLPEQYLQLVDESLKKEPVDAFGGPDSAHESFTARQKAISYSMTSFLTTGGIRGNKLMLDKFQIRSFNMGLSKKAFVSSGGFSRQSFWRRY